MDCRGDPAREAWAHRGPGGTGPGRPPVTRHHAGGGRRIPVSHRPFPGDGSRDVSPVHGWRDR